jgi:hypothetical protein
MLSVMALLGSDEFIDMAQERPTLVVADRSPVSAT